MRKRTVCKLLTCVLLCVVCTGCGALERIVDAAQSESGSANDKSHEARVFNEAVDAFFAALDAGDKAAMRALFAQSLQEDTYTMDSQMDKLLEVYTAPTTVNKRDGSRAVGDYSYARGEKSAQVGLGFPVVAGGREYWCSFSLRYQDDKHPEEIGVQRVTLYDAPSFCAMREGDVEKSSSASNGLFVYTDAPVDYAVRFVSGYPRKFTPVDRTITAKQAEAFFQSQSTYSALFAQFGQPNVSSPEGGWMAYELEPENGEPRFLDVTLKHQSDEISSAYITNDLDIVAVKTLWENGAAPLV